MLAEHGHIPRCASDYIGSWGSIDDDCCTPYHDAYAVDSSVGDLI